MEYNSDWKSYWSQLLETKKLEHYVSVMNQVDDALGHEIHIEEICHKIYEDYRISWQSHLEDVRINFLKIMEGIESVHLQTSRVKSVDSLLEKVITKRYTFLRDKSSVYSKIDGANYKDIITDLIGVRIILNFRGNWKEIHEEILGEFPYEKELFENDKNKEMTLPHSGKNRLVQTPKVYYAQGDNIEEYSQYGLNTELRKKGYRSIHYVISYQSVYIELQVRTIYDEAWSDCDHRYVYKHNQNKSHSALEKMSELLCQMTNLSNDWGDNIKYAFDTESFEDTGRGTWIADSVAVNVLQDAQDRLKKICNEVEAFRSRLEHKTTEGEP